MSTCTSTLPRVPIHYGIANAPWRVELRLSAFHPWRVAWHFMKLADAMSMESHLKRGGAQTRVRAN